MASSDVPLNRGIAVGERFRQTDRRCLISRALSGDGKNGHREEPWIAECDHYTATFFLVANQSVNRVRRHLVHANGGGADWNCSFSPAVKVLIGYI